MFLPGVPSGGTGPRGAEDNETIREMRNSYSTIYIPPKMVVSFSPLATVKLVTGELPSLSSIVT